MQDISHGTESQYASAPLFPKAFMSVSRSEYYGQDDDHQPLELYIYSRNQKQIQQDIKEQIISVSSCDFLESKYWTQENFDNNSINGPIPEDLSGHVFFIGSAGTFDSQKLEEENNVVLPAANGWTHIFYGDGIVYRLDFHSTCIDDVVNIRDRGDGVININHPGFARLTTRIMKTPDYYVDKALSSDEHNKYYKDKWPKEFNQSEFFDSILTRLSLTLGSRNLLNTACLPMKSKKNETERLLVTWDAGRPYEINPCTLNLLQPVGLIKDWHPLIELNNLSKLIRKIPFFSKIFPILIQVFPINLVQAHPQYDQERDVVYLVNASKSLRNILAIKKVVPQFTRGFEKSLEKETGQIFRFLLKLYNRLFLYLLEFIINIISALKIGGEDHLYLNQWNGDRAEIDSENKWEIVQENGRPIQINHSLHQMAITKDYIIISDSSFKLSVADVIPSILNPPDLIPLTNLMFPFSLAPFRLPPSRTSPTFVQEYIRFILSYINFPQDSTTDLYIIPHPDGNTSHFYKKKFLRTNRSHKKIYAKHIKISPETAHFLADYESTEGKIVLHVSHIAAHDPAEFTSKIDQPVCQYEKSSNKITNCGSTTTELLRERAGIGIHGMDVCRLGCWIIDTNSCDEPIKYIYYDDDILWGSAVYTWNENFSNRIRNIYWSNWGAWPFSLTKYYYDLYKDYDQRRIGIDEIINSIVQEGRPSSLINVKQTIESTSKKLELESCYIFPPGYFCNSPQFIPKNTNDENSAEGYIVCIVIATDNFLTDTPVIEDRKVCEFWIFNSEQLSIGPLFRLSHPKMNIGVTIHTAWLKQLDSPQLTSYDIRKDYHDNISKVKPENFQNMVVDLFERHVYPNV